MIFDTTYTNEEYTLTANKELGKPFSLLERIQKNGIGSSRLIIDSKSKQLYSNLKQFSEISYANIELRPKGIIVHFTDRLQRMAWLIPFYKLHIYSSDVFSIHADGNFIKFRKDKHYRSNKKFIDKLTDEKINFLQLGYYDG